MKGTVSRDFREKKLADKKNSAWVGPHEQEKPLHETFRFREIFKKNCARVVVDYAEKR